MSALDAGKVPFEPHSITPRAADAGLDRAVARLDSPATRAEPTGLATDVERIQSLLARPGSTRTRRLLWMWFRIFVRERRPGGNVETVNIRIPVPIPLIGAFLPAKASPERAARVAYEISLAEDREAALAVLDASLASTMAFEFVRVQSKSDRKGEELVVIGFD